MPKRPKISKEEKKRRSRLRAAKLRAKKKAEFLRRSKASKKGWQTRRQKIVVLSQGELDKKLEEARKQGERAGTEAGWNRGKQDVMDLMTGKLPVKEFLGPEEYAAALKELEEFHFREYTEEEQQKAIQARWREIDGLVGTPKLSRREQILMWAQRNGFDIREVWAEYRRRQGR